jgi:membrane associated rhomboid family serine protease
MVLPIRDLNPTRRVPHVNWLFIATNIAVFAWQTLGLADCEQVRFIYRFAAIPKEMLSLSQLSTGTAEQVLGSCATPSMTKIVAVSVVTSMFLHGSLLHLAGNMLFLFVFGDNVEDRLGPVRYILFYITGGILSAVAYAAFQPGSAVPLVGASGAVAAILGAYLILYPSARVLTYVPFPLYLIALVIPKVKIRLWLVIFAIVKMPAWLLLLGWLALQVIAVGSQTPGMIAYEAHIAGFLAGIVLILLLDRRRLKRGQQPLHPVRRQRGLGR